MGARGIRVEEPQDLGPALKEGIAERSSPTVIDVVVTRDPARMLPGVDARARAKVKPGDRPA
jgi:acetolactate synthase-1/2/3 large subunit